VDLPLEKVEWELYVQTCDQRPVAEKEFTLSYATTGISIEVKTDYRGLATFSPRVEQAMQVEIPGDEKYQTLGPIAFPARAAGRFRDTLTLDWQDPEGLVQVVDASGEGLEGALLSFKQLDGTTRREVADASGTYRWDVATASPWTQLSVDLVNYESRQVSTLPILGCPKPESFTVVLDEIPIEEAVDLDLILYDTDKWDLRPASKRELDKLVRFLAQRPTLRVELSSHTDSRNSHEYNALLSQRRAQACVDYIVSKGIPSDRIVARGYGETRLVNRCADGVECTEEQHQQNRRTELNLLTD